MYMVAGLTNPVLISYRYRMALPNRLPGPPPEPALQTWLAMVQKQVDREPRQPLGISDAPGEV